MQSPSDISQNEFYKKFFQLSSNAFSSRKLSKKYYRFGSEEELQQTREVQMALKERSLYEWLDFENGDGLWVKTRFYIPTLYELSIEHEKETLSNRWSIQTFMKVSRLVLNSLNDLHKQYIIHNNISEKSVMYDENSSVVVLGDLSQASFSNLRYGSKFSPQISRSRDIIAVGKVFYKLLVGDSYENKKKAALNLINFKVNKIVSDIIHAMIEGKYRTVRGVLRDLDLVLTKSYEESFFPATIDRDDIFTISNKVYGRQKEISTLCEYITEAINYSKQSKLKQSHMVLIKGSKGAGKSTLIHSLAQTGLKSVIFILDNFNQRFQQLPFSGFQVIFAELLKIYKKTFPDFKVRLKTVPHLIYQFLPALKKELSDIELQNLKPYSPKSQEECFGILLDFIRSFELDQELCFCFDDIHWMDQTSLEFIQYIFNHHNLSIVFICAYCPHKVSRNVNLRDGIRQLRQLYLPFVHSIDLQPILSDDLNILVKDSLQTTLENGVLLRKHIVSQFGNDLRFLQEMLVEFYKLGLLEYDTSMNVWSYNLFTIKQFRFPETEEAFEKFIQNSFLTLPSDTKLIVQYIACIGTNYVCGGSLKSILIELHELLQSESAISDANLMHMLVPAIREGYIHDKTYQFVDPSFREFILKTVDQDFQRDMFLKLGYIFQREQLYLHSAIYFMLGLEGIESLDEAIKESRCSRHELIQFFLKTLSSRENSISQKDVLCIAEFCKKLMGDDPFQDYFKEVFFCNQIIASCYIHLHSFDKATSILTQLLQRSGSNSEKCKIWRLLILNSNEQSDYKTSFHCLKDLLSYFSSECGSFPGTNRIKLLSNWLDNQIVEAGEFYRTDSFNSNQITDETILGLMGCFFESSHHYFSLNHQCLTEEELLTYQGIFLLMGKWTLQFGHSSYDQASLYFASIAFISYKQDFQTTLRLQKILLSDEELKSSMEKSNQEAFSVLCQAHFPLRLNMKEHYSLYHLSFDLFFQKGLGSFWNIQVAISSLTCHVLLGGNVFIAEEKCHLFANSLFSDEEDPNLIHLVSLENLISIMKGDLQNHEALSNEEPSVQIGFQQHLIKAVSFFFLNDMNSAFNHIEQCQNYRANYWASPSLHVYYFWRGIILTEACQTGTDKSELIEKLKFLLDDLDIIDIMDKEPNVIGYFSCIRLLISTEIKILKNESNMELIMKDYQAIDALARQSESSLLQAIVATRLANFIAKMDIGKQFTGVAIMTALRFWGDMGIRSRVEQLCDEYEAELSQTTLVDIVHIQDFVLTKQTKEVECQTTGYIEGYPRIAQPKSPMKKSALRPPKKSKYNYVWDPETKKYVTQSKKKPEASALTPKKSLFQLPTPSRMSRRISTDPSNLSVSQDQFRKSFVDSIIVDQSQPNSPQSKYLSPKSTQNVFEKALAIVGDLKSTDFELSSPVKKRSETPFSGERTGIENNEDDFKVSQDSFLGKHDNLNFSEKDILLQQVENCILEEHI